MSDFQFFYQRLGLSKYPFSTFTAENEEEYLKELFTKPNDYSLIEDAHKGSKSMIIVGERGTGKTILLNQLLSISRKGNPESSLIIKIDDYSKLDKNASLTDFYRFFIGKISVDLFKSLVTNRKRIKKLQLKDKYFLAYLLVNFVPQVSKNELKDSINKITNRKRALQFIKLFNYFRMIINYGLTAASNILKDTILEFFVLPSIDKDGKIRELLPEIVPFEEIEFLDEKASFQLLQKVAELVESLEYHNLIIVLDKLDEDSRWDNDYEVIAGFIKPILTDSKLLLSDKFQLLVSVWAIPFDSLKSSVRTQKYYCPRLLWNNNDLKKALNKRLSVFSNVDKEVDFDSIFDSSVQEKDKQGIFELANKSPRDLWHLMNQIVRAQFKYNSASAKLSQTAISNGFITFIKEFNYFEYYPKKRNASKTKLDIYSYLHHLQRNKLVEFTKNQLKVNLNASGSSVNNYIISMEKMGLIKRMESSGASNMYKINDPKVTWAIKHGIEIRRQ